MNDFSCSEEEFLELNPRIIHPERREEMLAEKFGPEIAGMSTCCKGAELVVPIVLEKLVNRSMIEPAEVPGIALAPVDEVERTAEFAAICLLANEVRQLDDKTLLGPLLERFGKDRLSEAVASVEGGPAEIEGETFNEKLETAASHCFVAWLEQLPGEVARRIELRLPPASRLLASQGAEISRSCMGRFLNAAKARGYA